MLLIAQAILVFRYFGFMVGQTPKTEVPVGNDYSPSTAVILCLRGDDPSLNACIESLFALDYPNFQIHFVIDSHQDPALQTIQDILQKYSNSRVKTKTVFLTKNSDHSAIVKSCSLKNQALTTAISNAEEAIEVFALVDADGVVEKTWLSDLVAPLADQSVGATTGSRWFAPQERNPGSLVRQTWNAAALPQMNFYNIPWGGALAIKRSTIDNCELLLHWSIGFCEDTMLPKILAEKDFKLVQVPSVIVESTETTTLRSSANWISRQLLTVRLHHNSWPLVLGHAVSSGVCLLGALIAFAMCLWAQQFFQATRLAITIMIFLAANVMLLQVIQFANRRGTLQGNLIPTDSETSNPFASSRGPGFYGALLTQTIYPLIAIKAALMKKVQWRGITYSIGPGKKISMDAYQPYQETSRDPGADGSPESL